MTNFDTFAFDESPPTETVLVEGAGQVPEGVGDAQTLIGVVPADFAALSQDIVEDLLQQELVVGHAGVVGAELLATFA